MEEFVIQSIIDSKREKEKWIFKKSENKIHIVWIIALLNSGQDFQKYLVILSLWDTKTETI